MTFLVLLVFSFKRLKSRVGLASLLILATAMTVGIIVCIPVFADAVSRQIMKQELGIGRLKHRPPFAVRFHASGQARFPITLEDAEGYGSWLHQTLVSSVGLPTEAAYMQANSRRYDLLPREGDTRYKQERLGNASVFTVDQIEKHVQIVSGEPIGAGLDSADYLPLWVEESFAAARALQTGESYELGDLFDPSILRIPVRVVGIWQRIDPEEQYWYTDPSWNLDQNLYTTPEAYARHVYPRYEAGARYVFWYFIFDEGKMNLSRADHYIAALERVGREVAERLPAGAMEGAPIEQLQRGQARKQDLILLFSGVSLPLVAITLYFLGAMSVIYSRLQSQETAVLTSRGSSRAQIVGLAAIETVVILLFAVPLGIALGMLVASILGYSSSFLSFVPREPLQVNLASVDWRLVALATAITVVFRVVPSWSLSRLTLVLHEQQSARRPLLWGGARLLLIGFLGAATVYGYQQLVASGSLSLVSWTPNDPTHDPLILIAPSLFLLTVPLILAELFVLLARPLAWVGRLLPGVSGYLGLVDLSREGGRYRTPVYLLVLSLSIGVFYASLARSADRWLVDRRQYEIGSDLTFKPRTEEDNIADGGSATGMELAQGLARLPVSDYERIEGVRAVSPVGQYKAAVQAGKVQASGRLLAVDRIRFAQVAYYRSDYSTRSLGEMLNRLGAEPAGILVPNAVARQLEVGEGDNIRLNVQLEENEWYSFEFTIVGTFDYFPTMLIEGEHTFVTNLDYLQTETAGSCPMAFGCV